MRQMSVRYNKLALSFGCKRRPLGRSRFNLELNQLTSGLRPARGAFMPCVAMIRLDIEPQRVRACRNQKLRT